MKCLGRLGSCNFALVSVVTYSYHGALVERCIILLGYFRPQCIVQLYITFELDPMWGHVVRVSHVAHGHEVCE